VPIYEYVCEACGRLTELMQRVSDPAPTDCPQCGERKLARVVSRTSFQLRGGGWYSDLYASPKKKAEGGGAEKSPAAGATEKPPAAGPTEKPPPAAATDKPAGGTKSPGS
jgi:putative FmdB family regulatory protein